MFASLSSALHPQVDGGRVFGGLSALQEEVGCQELIHISSFTSFDKYKENQDRLG